MNRGRKIHVSIFWSILGILLGAGSYPSSAKAQTPLDPDLQTMILNSIKTLTRPIVVYHYGRRGKPDYDANDECLPECDEIIDLPDDPLPLEHPEIKHYFTAMTRQFSENKDNYWHVGGGLYAGIDPLQSGSYAHDPWFMLQIRIPAGTRYIDVRDEALRSRLDGHFGQSPALSSFLKSNQVSLIAYGWATTAYHQCARPDQRAAFNFIDPDLYDHLTIRLFAQQLEDQPEEAKHDAYRKLFLEGFSAAFALRSPDLSLLSLGREIDTSYSASAGNLFVGWAYPLGNPQFTPDEIGSILHTVMDETFTCSSDHPEEFNPSP